MAEILSGKEISKNVREQLMRELEQLAEQGVTPGLAVILVGNNPASEIYVRNKARACAELGIDSQVIRLSEYISQSELIEEIRKLNGDNAVDGVMVQLPLPNHIDENAVLDAISPEKDVDGLHAMSAGRLMTGRPTFVACTPKGVMRMLQEAGVKLTGLSAVVIGRSNIVGKPMAMLLLQENATVTICHSRTRDLKSITQNADVVVAAVGIAGFVTADMVKPGAIVVDVGINRTDEGKVVGDVAFDEVSQVASLITPVPGGVGLMTITMLMENTIEAARLHAHI